MAAEAHRQINLPQHFLYFLPLPHEQGSFLPGFGAARYGFCLFVSPCSGNARSKVSLIMRCISASDGGRSIYSAAAEITICIAAKIICRYKMSSFRVLGNTSAIELNSGASRLIVSTAFSGSDKLLRALLMVEAIFCN